MTGSSPNGGPNRRLRCIVWWSVLAIWTVLLLIPIPSTGPLADMPPSRREIIAKFGHVLAYLGLTAMAGWLRVPVRWRWLLIFVLMAHGSVTELLQIPVGRGGSLADVGWDHLGVGL